MNDDAVSLLESVADFLCSHDREGTSVLVRAISREYVRLRKSEAFHVEACAAHQRHIDELQAELKTAQFDAATFSRLLDDTLRSAGRLGAVVDRQGKLLLECREVLVAHHESRITATQPGLECPVCSSNGIFQRLRAAEAARGDI